MGFNSGFKGLSEILGLALLLKFWLKPDKKNKYFTWRPEYIYAIDFHNWGGIPFQVRTESLVLIYNLIAPKIFFFFCSK